MAERRVLLVAAWDGPKGDELVLAASRRLVASVAAGRPHDHRMAGIEAAFTRWVDVHEAKDPSPEAKERTDAYIEAWGREPATGRVTWPHRRAGERERPTHYQLGKGWERRCR